MMRLTVLALVLWATAAPAVLADNAAPATPPTPAVTTTPAQPTTDAAASVPDVPKLSNFADLVFAGIVGENAPELTMDFVAGTTLGTLPLAFEKTTLADIAALYGGTAHSQGDADNGVTWLCYTQHAATRRDTPRTVWFTSTNEMAGAGNTLSMVVVENVDAAKASGCQTAPKSFAFPSFAVPAIGAPLGALKARFGVLVRDRQHNIYYNSTRPLNDGSGQSVYQTLGYRMDKRGVVAGIALSQVTTD